MPPKPLFPVFAVKEARKLADTIARTNSGQPMHRLDIFHELKKSAESSSSRRLVTASSQYGLTIGSYKAEILELAPLGKRLAIDENPAAAIEAVFNVDIFKKFFEKYKNSSLPAEVPAKSFLASAGIPAERTKECHDVILETGRGTGLIMLRGGGEKVLSREHAIELAAKGAAPQERPPKDKQREGERDRAQPDEKQRRALPSLNINLEIHLPVDAKPEVYDAIFASMRKHLVDVE